MKRLVDAVRSAFSTPPIDPALQAAARKTWLETFPDRKNPPVTFRVEAETSEDTVVAVSNLDPGSIDYIRVSKKDGAGTFVAEDQQKYRPPGFK